ncbi:MAG TPA: recombinase RecT [Methylotenera sp.]|nr:recombinase RecT [Methylotenera sp.]
MSNEIIEQESSRASSISIITNDNYMDRVMKLASMMASSKVTVPKHLQNNEGDCAAIIMQAMNWGMDPFIVAQKTHLVNGTLGYEAQLVNAVAQSSNAIKGTFSYEYKDEGGTAPNAFVSCRVGAVLNGQSEITWGEWLASASVTTKNSPLWKTNLKQQMGYLQVKNWNRAYCPGAIMGVYSVDELQDTPIEEIDVTKQGETLPPAKEYVLDVDFNAGKVKFKAAVDAGKHTVESLTTWIETKGKLLTESQKAEIKSWVKPEPQTVDNEATQSTNNSDFLGDYDKAEATNHATA